jgi:hypothetical protein
MEENEKATTSALLDTIEAAFTGIPAPVRKNIGKAFGQLCSAAVDIPVAWLEGKASEIRANTEARIQIISKGGSLLSEQIEVPKEYIHKASSKFAARIIKEQQNLDQIVGNAAKEIKCVVNTESDNKEADDISEDWLNEFENLARLKSSDEMRLAFGKILSGEIIKPGSFSIKTIKLISQLDNEAAELFQLFCSLAVSMRIGGRVRDGRVVTVAGNAASNSLLSFGLSFDDLNVLQEYGLIIADYNSYMPYSPCIANEEYRVNAVLHYKSKDYGLVPTDRAMYDKELMLHGVALTNAGKELMDIVPVTKSELYEAALIDFFKARHLELKELE